MPEIRVTRELAVPLTAEEQSQLGKRLVEALADEDLVLAEKRKHVQVCNEKLKEIHKRVMRVRGAIETGSELRDVQCIERPGITNGTVDVVRLDTGEVIETITDDPERAMDVAQQELPITRPGKACDYCGNADGTHRADVPHGHAKAVDARGNERIVPLTPSQREGLEAALENGEGVSIEFEGETIELVALAEDEGETDEDDELDALDLLDADARDDGADAIAALGGDVEHEETPAKPAKKRGRSKNGKSEATP